MRETPATVENMFSAASDCAPLPPETGKEVISGLGVEVKRTFDAARFNVIANHPDVRPWLGGEGEIDLTDVVGNPANFALAIEGGGFLLVARDTGIYEVHSLFLPEARRYSLGAMRSGMEYMFCRTDAFRLITQVPDGNTAAAALARKGGFRTWYRREHGAPGPSEFLVIDIDDWVQATPALEADGEWFHERLLAAKAAAGSERPVHAHEPAHERAVGAAVRMIRGGNPGKGVATYNRWASSAGYAALTIVSFNPFVVDAVDAVVEVRGAEMEVLLCR